MNKTVKEYLEFVEGVNEEYWAKTGDSEVIPVCLKTCGGQSIIELDIDCVLCSTENENLDEGIESIDKFIKKLKSIKRVLVKKYNKLSDDQLEYFGVYPDEGDDY